MRRFSPLGLSGGGLRACARGRLLALLLLCLPLVGRAQAALDTLASRVNLFGTQLPQEKVFIHTDNTAYFLGDTIFYQAYVTRTDRGVLSTLSGVLYVELLNADGYLIERQVVRLKSGLGNGSIILHKGRAHYAGYYELRAYTRWMLNFGRTTLPHQSTTEHWFVRRHMAKEFYVDYDKIYSRTFPVYDAPMAPGEYYPDMTERPMQRLMGGLKRDESIHVTLFPEGGNLIAGVPNRLYFEAATGEGRHVAGTLVVADSHGNELARAATENRGKGVADIGVPKDGKLKITFVPNGQPAVKVDAPTVRTFGVALRPVMADSMLTVTVHRQDGGRRLPPLALTVMHTGVVVHTAHLDGNPIVLPLADLPQGVLDLTVYDDEGRIWADRLVFNSADPRANRLRVVGVAKEYTPYSTISFEIHAPTRNPSTAVVSVAITDADNSDVSADNGNMMTEMLLASELKGFIEQPTYYFEEDDDTHRHHLDLLMATQGWRRFNWQVQSHPERFTVAELNEPRTPRLNGAVYTYEAIRKADELQDAAERDLDELTRNEFDVDFDAQFTFNPYKDRSLRVDDETQQDKNDTSDPTETRQLVSLGDAADEAAAKGLMHFGKEQSEGRERYMKNPGNLSSEVTVHAEFISAFKETFEGEATTDRSRFNIEQPDLDYQFHMHLAAADTTKWNTARQQAKLKKGKKARKAKHVWIMPDEEEYPDYYVRISDPFPRHAHPYPFYRTTLLPKQADVSDDAVKGYGGTFDDRILDEVLITSGRKGKRRFDRHHPALALSAYEAYNLVCDAGLCPGQFVGAGRFAQDISRTLFGDMGVERQYRLNLRRDGLHESHTMSAAARAEYDKLENIDSVFVYTDYAPRHYGNPLWKGENQPDVVIDVRRFADGGRQVTFRDRYYLRQGFNVCEDFYHPDYSQVVPPPRADMRRTLLWLPMLKLTADRPLVLKAFNNGKTTHPRVTVNGITLTGTPLTNF